MCLTFPDNVYFLVRILGLEFNPLSALRSKAVHCVYLSATGVNALYAFTRHNTSEVINTSLADRCCGLSRDEKAINKASTQ